jgi:hypothetical protein
MYNPYYNPNSMKYPSPFDLDPNEYSKDAMIRRIPKPIASPQPEQGKPLNAANIGQAAIGAAEMIGGWASMYNEGKDINTTAPSQEVDAYGKPVYNIGEFTASSQAIRPQGATGGEILGSTAKGASIGSQIAPGIGTAIGAGIGALGSIIGGIGRKRRMRKARQNAIRSIRTRQGQYNTSMRGFNSQQRAIDEYNLYNNS